MSRPTPDGVVATVLTAKSLRTYCYGFLGVLFPLHLASLGLGPEGIGVAVALTLVSSAGLTLAVRRPAERLSSRTVLNTMVFSHLASNVFLIAVALAPAAGPAVALLLLRALLSQIDVPTRQAFLMAVVGDHEREAAATLTNASRTVAQALSPALIG